MEHRPADYSKTFSLYSDDTPDRSVFTYVIQSVDPHVPFIHVEWCKAHCTQAWAWWFEQDNAYLGFASQEESVWFSIANAGAYRAA
jgi:hypothetical protein